MYGHLARPILLARDARLGGGGFHRLGQYEYVHVRDGAVDIDAIDGSGIKFIQLATSRPTSPTGCNSSAEIGVSVGFLRI